MPRQSTESCSSIGSLNDDLMHSENRQLEWGDFSIMLEMKVNDTANVHISCPMPVSNKQVEDVEVIKFGEKGVEYIQDLTPEGSSKTDVKRYGAMFPHIQFLPKSATDGAWSECRRLFTCRIQLEYRDFVGGVRRFSELNAFINSKVPLKEYCDRLSKNGIRLSCSVCQMIFFVGKDEKPVKFLPTEMYTYTACMDSRDDSEYVLNSCANQHGDCHNGAEIKPQSKDQKSADIPNAYKDYLSDALLVVKATDALQNVVSDKGKRIVKCGRCSAELGRMAEDSDEIYRFHVTGVAIEDMTLNKTMISERYGSLERYFSALLLRVSADDCSLKLAFRTLDKSPYILVWLMEPIIVFADGKLKELTEDMKLSSKQKENKKMARKDASVIYTTCALKVLYKVFDANVVENTKMFDSSISIVDIPHSSCLQLEEILLRNSARLPPPSRFLGNFLVSFLNIDDD